MERYFIHLRRTGEPTLKDPEGSELPDLNAAKEEALTAARELLAETIKAGQEVTSVNEV